MIAEAIDKILENAYTPNTTVRLEDGSGRIFLWSPPKNDYVELDRIVIQKGSVSNIESFAALVLEEARRRENETGDFMTVVFSEHGAAFSPDDSERLDKFTYERTLSPQWQLLTANAGVPLEHLAFVRLLQKLRPSIDGYNDLVRQFKKISFDSNVAVTSAPFLEQGSAGSHIAVSLTVKGTSCETTLPSEFSVGMQYARGSEKSYGFDVEIDASLFETNGKKSLRFTLVVPQMANIAEQAVKDEIEYFRAQTKALPNLLTLVDF